MEKLFNLEKKNVVLTGSHGLIGSALSKALTNKCENLIKLDKKDIHEKAFIQVDLTKTENIKKVVVEILEKYQRIDVWINCHYPKDYSDWNSSPDNFSPQTFTSSFNDHAFSYYQCAKEAADTMKVMGLHGSIINFSSIFGFMSPNFEIYQDTGKFLNLAYPTIKGAITNMTKSLSVYYAPSGIRFNTISPGAIENNQHPKIRDHYLNRTPLKRMARPEDLIGAVAFLAADSSNFMTGQDLVIDGGYSIL